MRPILLVLVVVLAQAGAASAKPKIALVPFDGDPRDEAREAVSDALDGDVAVLPAARVGHALEDLGVRASALDEDHLRQLAGALDADAVVQARYSLRGRIRLLHFRLFVHGQQLRGFTVAFGSLRSARFQKLLHDKLIERMALPTDEPAPEPAPPDAPAAAPEATPPPAHVAVAGDAGEPTVTAHVDVAPASGPVARTANRDAVRVDVGPSMSRRWLSFDSRAFPQAPAGYRDSVVPGARVEAELYPYAFADPQRWASGFGIAAFYDQTLFSNATTSIQPGTKFPVTQYRVEAELRYRLVFGHAPASPSLTIAVGYDRRSFTFDRTELLPGNTLDVPDVTYADLEPSLRYRQPIGPRFAIALGLGGMVFQSEGSITTASEYGPASMLGFDGDLELDLALTNRIGLRAAFEFARIGYKFSGTGAMANDRDGMPDTIDVNGADDLYFSGALTLAVMY